MARHQKVEFSKALGQLEFRQFLELCNVLGVGVIDRDSVREAVEKKDGNADFDMKKVKGRTDWDCIAAELQEKYAALPRYNRRQLDRVIAKICWGNRRAREILREVDENGESVSETV